MFGIEDFTQKIVDFANFDISQLGNALLFGGAMLLIGMATVFSVLALLWLCLVLFKLFFHDIPTRRASMQKVAPVAVETVNESPKSDAEGEIVAVIAAAIAMAESESGGMKFKVVSFKRK